MKRKTVLLGTTTTPTIEQSQRRVGHTSYMAGRSQRWVGIVRVHISYGVQSSIHDFSTDIIEETVHNAEFQHRTGDVLFHIFFFFGAIFLVGQRVNATSVANDNRVAEYDLRMTLNAKDLAKKDSATESRVQYTNERLKRANGSDKGAIIGIVIFMCKSRICAAVTLEGEKENESGYLARWVV